jgi:hypothetical protein
MKRGTFQIKGKPTRFTVELYLKYFELGGKPDDKKMNPFISSRIKDIMGWEEGEGTVSLMWAFSPETKVAKRHEYYIAMVKAKELAWEIHNSCAPIQ